MPTFEVLTIEYNPDTNNQCVRTRAIDSNNILDDFYKYLDCTTVDCVEIEIDGHSYDIWCDDEGLLVSRPIMTLYLSEAQIICGNVLFARRKDSETIGLETDDIIRIGCWLRGNREKLRNFTHRKY